MNIGVVGGGYVGLVTAACLAELGHFVTCVETDPSRYATLSNGEIPIYEPGLKELVEKNRKRSGINFFDRHESLSDTKIVFLAVGTPPMKNGGADTSQLFQAISDVMQKTTEEIIFVVKSTVPVGTNRKIAAFVDEHFPNRATEIVSNPEFLREGSAVSDFFSPDRIIFGGTDEHLLKTLCNEIYAQHISEGIPTIFSNWETAELIKYSSNAFLATKVTFINELAQLAASTEADIHKISQGMGLDKRISESFLTPGPGYGGSCFPKDTRALEFSASEYNVSLDIVTSTISSNEKIKQIIVKKVLDILRQSVELDTVGILGVTFKKNTDDVRESVAIPLVSELLKTGKKVKIFDPKGLENFSKLETGYIECGDAMSAIKGSDLLVILTEWDFINDLDPLEIRDSLKGDTIIDTRYMLDKVQYQQAGLRVIN